jgi:hypothetical protein
VLKLGLLSDEHCRQEKLHHFTKRYGNSPFHYARFSHPLTESRCFSWRHLFGQLEHQTQNNISL